MSTSEKNNGRWALAWLSALSLSLMAGCAVGPDFVRPKPPAIDHYTSGAQPGETISADGQSQRFDRGVGLVADWWRLFNSSKLDGLMKEAVANNQNLLAAQASLRQSQESLQAGYGVFYPQLDAGFTATRQRSAEARFGDSSSRSRAGSSNGVVFNLYTLTAAVSYALDVFGGERRRVESLQAQVDSQRGILLGAYLTLTGNVTNTAIALAAYREQINVTGQIIGLQREQVRIAEAQARAGTAPYSNVVSLQSQLAATEATLPPLRQRYSQAEHLLATLAGRAPSEWAPPLVDLAELTLPGDLPLTLPSELVRQRPDILSAEAQLHGASAEIGVATAAMFPSITLNGSYGFSSNSTGDLLKRASNIWSVGPNLTAPIFRGGSLWYKRRAAIEAYNQSLANYRQTVLNAFAQVADTLRALEHDAETLQAQSRAVGAAEEALRLVQANYQAGIANYLQVIIADNQYQQARIGHIQAQAQRYQDTVALFVALGGGWWNAGENILNNEPATEMPIFPRKEPDQ